MAKEKDNAQVEPQEETKESGGNGRRKSLMMGGIFLAVMALEAGVVVFLVKSFSPAPQAAEAAIGGLDPTEGEQAAGEAEIPVVQFRAQNNRGQRLLIYDLNVYASVPKPKAEEFATLVEERNAKIQDRFTRIIRSAEAERFAEPDLATLRRQFKHALSEIVEDEEMVLEILLPSVVSYSED